MRARRSTIACLNEVEGLSQPTLERISIWLWDRLHNRLPGLAEIEVARDSCHEGCVYRGPRAPACGGVEQMARKITGLQQLGAKSPLPKIAGRGRARARAQPASRHGLCRALHLP